MLLKFKCKNDAERKAAEHFLTWLCEQGEQDYWNWMAVREQEEEGPITIVRFEYDFVNMTACSSIGRHGE